MAEQGLLRDELSSRLGIAGVGSEQVLDTLLVVTELSTNALTHGAASSVEISVRVVADEIRVCVEHERIVDTTVPEFPAMPGSTSPRGRGLAIVHAIASSVTVDVTAATVKIDVTLPVST